MVTLSTTGSPQGITTIDQVIEELEGIINWSIDHNSRVGYFAVLYHRVTCRIKKGIEQNEFEDGARMEMLDVLFAERYIHAWKQWIADESPTNSWEKAFDATTNSATVILQHLLLGINAHINLDLGIATDETMLGQPCIEEIIKDFDVINSILASLVDEVEKDLSKVSPMIWLVQKMGKGYQDKLATFSIDIARVGAWYFSCLLRIADGEEYKETLEERDASIARLADALAKPKNRILRSLVWLAGIFEWRQPKHTIEQLRYIVEKAAAKSIERDVLQIKCADPRQ